MILCTVALRAAVGAALEYAGGFLPLRYGSSALRFVGLGPAQGDAEDALPGDLERAEEGPE